MDDLARLGLEVDSQPLVRARDELGRFVKVAQETETATGRARDALGRFVKMGGEAGSVAEDAAKRTKALADRVEQLAQRYDAAHRATTAITKAQQVLNSAEAAGLITSARKRELLNLVAEAHGRAGVAATIQARAETALANASRFLMAQIAPLAALIGGVLTGRAFIQNTIEAQASLAQLEATIRSTGGAAGFTSAELVEMSEALQKVTTFSDDNIQRAQSVLLTYTQIGHETFPRALKATLDMAQAMGIDLPQAAERVGRALGTPSRATAALSQQGFVFTGSQRALIKSLEESGRVAEAQAIILGELELAYEGSAEAARTTLGGALAALTNSFGDLFEVSKEGSQDLIDAINELTDLISEPGTVSAFQDFGAAAFGWVASAIDDLRLLAAVINNISAGNIGDAAALLNGRGLGTDFEARAFASAKLRAGIGDRAPSLESFYRATGRYSDADSPMQKRGDTSGDKTDDEIRDLERLQKQFDDALKNTTRQTQALEIQAATFGMASGQAAEYAKRHELINLAMRNGIELTPEVLDGINAQAEAFGRATEHLERLQAAAEGQAFLAQTFYDAAKGADSLAAAGRRAAQALADAVFQALLLGQGPLAGAFGTTSNSGGSIGAIFSALFGGFGAGPTGGAGLNGGLPAVHHGGGVIGAGGVPTRSVDPGVFDGAMRMHNGGGVDWAGGERPIIAKVGEVVGWPEQMAEAYGGRSVSITVPISVGGDMSNDQIAEAGAAAIRDALDKYDRRLPDRVAQIAKNPRRR